MRCTTPGNHNHTPEVARLWVLCVPKAYATYSRTVSLKVFMGEKLLNHAKRELPAISPSPPKALCVTITAESENSPLSCIHS